MTTITRYQLALLSAYADKLRDDLYTYGAETYTNHLYIDLCPRMLNVDEESIENYGSIFGDAENDCSAADADYIEPTLTVDKNTEIAIDEIIRYAESIGVSIEVSDSDSDNGRTTTYWFAPIVLSDRVARYNAARAKAQSRGENENEYFDFDLEEPQNEGEATTPELAENESEKTDENRREYLVLAELDNGDFAIFGAVDDMHNAIFSADADSFGYFTSFFTEEVFAKVELPSTDRVKYCRTIKKRFNVALNEFPWTTTNRFSVARAWREKTGVVAVIGREVCLHSYIIDDIDYVCQPHCLPWQLKWYSKSYLPTLEINDEELSEIVCCDYTANKNAGEECEIYSTSPFFEEMLSQKHEELTLQKDDPTETALFSVFCSAPENAVDRRKKRAEKILARGGYNFDRAQDDDQ